MNKSLFAYTHTHSYSFRLFLHFLPWHIILCMHACVYVGECVTDVYNFRWFAVSWPVDLQVTFIFCVWCVNIEANTLTQTSIYVYLCKQINRHTHKHTFRRIYYFYSWMYCLDLSTDFAYSKMSENSAEILLLLFLLLLFLV